jgi:predicted O-methyltransferase YrrM
MIPYIGDISRADALVLKQYAERNKNILEFGCGASTQVIAKYTKGKIVSIDTSNEWIERTKKNLELLNIEKHVIFSEYSSFMRLMTPLQLWCTFDFIFVDGVDSMRREFALRIWNNLSVGGKMAFHDTRRAPDFRNFIEVVAAHFTEISHITLNIGGSNISVLEKKENEPYDNWQITEDKKPWMLGYGEPDLDYLEKHKENE